jgi:diguanylate cyclase (GGDEF)-like protein
MLPLQQNNSAINTNSAAIARLNPGPLGQTLACASSLNGLLRNLTLRLQTSLELDRLLGFFFSEVRTLIPLGALVYRHAETDFHLQVGEIEPCGISYQLSHHDECLGELDLYSHTPLSETTQKQLEKAIGCLLFPLCNALLYRRAVQASLKDPLTGAGNRMALEQALNREIDISRRYGQALSVIMLDMDHFKNINDTYGHHAGDSALRAVALLLKEQLRNIDMAFRFGGEEFVLLLANTDTQAAAIVGERIRLAIEKLPLLVGEKTVQLSASLGCATYQPGESQQALLQRADQALYDAKHSGRNRLCFAAA